MLDTLTVELFADGADRDAIFALADDPKIKGFTTNPSLMWKAGLTHYETFARSLLERITDKPVSFEVFADDESEIRRQALLIQSWGSNAYVKIPVTTTKREPLWWLAHDLSHEGVQLNVTAVMTVQQVEELCPRLTGGAASFVSIFAGRIADAGVDPVPMVRRCATLANMAGTRLIWASAREVLNVVQANDTGCHVITMTSELLSKLPLLGKSLDDYSLETVRMFHDDATKAGYSL